MNPRRFYEQNKYANPIPVDGLSNDELASDSDSEVPTSSIPFRRPEIIQETDDKYSDEDDFPLANSPTASKKKNKNLLS